MTTHALFFGNIKEIIYNFKIGKLEIFSKLWKFFELLDFNISLIRMVTANIPSLNLCMLKSIRMTEILQRFPSKNGNISFNNCYSFVLITTNIKARLKKVKMCDLLKIWNSQFKSIYSVLSIYYLFNFYSGYPIIILHASCLTDMFTDNHEAFIALYWH